MPSVKENLKRIRTEKNMTQKQLGSLCGIAESTIRRYENGGLNPKLETVKKIADALEVPYPELMEIKGAFCFDFSKGFEGEPDVLYVSKEDIIDYKTKKRVFSEEWIKQYEKLKNYRLLQEFLKLNETGQEKAQEHIEMLTKIKEYQKEDV